MTEWIKTSDKLPVPGTRVIGYDKYRDRIGECTIPSHNNKILVFLDNGEGDIEYWQPFPKPPQ